MIFGTGIDLVEVARFTDWHKKNHKQLLHTFSKEEIDYCLSDIDKSSQRFAVRFAAREAFYKALCVAWPNMPIPFLTLCKNVTITKKNRVPQLIVNWQQIANVPEHIKKTKIHCSLAHEKLHAIAIVTFEFCDQYAKKNNR
jgi:holo-[acyl-carrier protein] synthase